MVSRKLKDRAKLFVVDDVLAFCLEINPTSKDETRLSGDTATKPAWIEFLRLTLAAKAAAVKSRSGSLNFLLLPSIVTLMLMGVSGLEATAEAR